MAKELKETKEPKTFNAHVIEMHQPVEVMGNKTTITADKADLERLENGDWLVKSKASKNEYLIGAGNVKAVRLKAAK